jgi:tetratricopeptide (TPR) repeat protein
LEQATAYVVHHGLSFGEYLDSWQVERDAVLAWHDAALMGYPASVAATWQKSFARLGACPRALSRLLAHLAPEPVATAMLVEATEVLDEAVESLCEEEGLDPDPGSPRTALAELASYSLVDREGEQVVMHRLVQEVVRGRIPEERRREWAERAVRLVYDFSPAGPGDVRTWEVWDPLRPHASRVIELAERMDARGLTSALMHNLGELLYAKALHEDAEPLMRRALAIDETSFGSEHPNVARDLNNLALLLQATNRLEDAEPLMRRALAILEASLGEDHPHTQLLRRNLDALLSAGEG